ncbi:extracellular endo-alpha-(1-_5)-L-arabinanase 2 precursor [mine drainage metagenome]|uniref:Extracellular endo-alpha-(1->5)-L-arabinanase 2 n=1 Tax=mine drainage metagenome TaxID=410659 RepID=A0A1J5SII2_9ZZZZ
MTLLRRLLLVLSGVLAAFLVSPASASPTFSNVSVHDPSVVRDGSTYYVFGSHMASASTADLMHWTQITTAPTYPNSLIRNQDPQTEFADALAWAQTTTFWGPDVIKLGDGKYYYYYCACQGSSPLSALGLAKADAVTGPYANVGILLKSGMSGISPTGSVYDVNVNPNVVDPSVFYDADGKLWMVYGSFSGGIFILQLDSTPGSPTIGQPLPNQGGYGKKLIGGNSSRIEGPYIIYSPETQYYYLFMTFGGLDAAGGYNIRVGRSRAPDGPYVDAAGNDLTNVKGNFAFDDATIAPYGVKLMGNYQFLHVDGEPTTASQGYVSPGGCSIYRDPQLGRYILVIHTRFVGKGEYHEVRAYQLYLNEDGWFVASPQRFAGETIATTDPSLVPGTYRFINHGKAISATVNNSTLATLNADGSVSGSVSGTWALSGDHFITLVLGGVTYKGVVVQDWDDDNQVWVESFSALSSDGVSVWGCKVAATTTNVAPSITLPPSDVSVTAGSSATFSVSASGTPAPTYQWRRNGVNIAGATGSSYTISSTTAGDAAAYSVVVANSVAAFQSQPAVLSVSAPAGPAISVQPESQDVDAGTSYTFSVTATGTGTLSYQWHFNGTDIPGATGSSYTIASVAAANAGAYTVTVTDSAGNVTSSNALLAVSYPTPNSDARLSALSCRAVVGNGSDVLIPAFIVGGTGSQQVVVRASGPALAQYGITDTLAQPKMELHRVGVDATVATNVGWSSGTADATAALQAAFLKVGLPAFPVGSADSAMIVTVSAGQAYTVVVRGADGTGGTSLVELYELGGNAAPLTALSCRAMVGTGDKILVPGIIISGTKPRELIIRASGPALNQYGVTGTLAQPRLELFSGTTKIAENVGWSTAANAATVATVSPKVGLANFPAGSPDCAILVTLKPGIYTAQVSGLGGTTGVALVEVYVVP